MFTGVQVVATERDKRLLVIEAIREPTFTSPPGTFALHLPIAGIIDVHVEPTTWPGFVKLVFVGDFSGIQPGTSVELAPVDASDAAALAALLKKRYRLPKMPRHGVERDAQTPELVTLVATYTPHHHDADFGFVRLECDADQRAQLVPGQTYHVTGFFHPRRHAAPPLPTSFAGPWLRVFAVASDHITTPCPACVRVVDGPRACATRSIIARSRIGTGDHGFRGRDFYSLRGDDELVVALLAGTGSQHTGEYVAKVAQQALAILLSEPAYGSIPYQPKLPPAGTSALDIAAWVPALVDQAALPSQPPALLAELARRVGDVIAALAAEGGQLSAFGAIAHVRGRTVTVDRRGGVRAYLVRDDEVACVIRDHSLQEELRAAGVPAPPILSAMLSWLGACEAAQPPVEIELRAGDRLVIVPWLVYDCLDEAGLDRVVRDSGDGARELETHCDDSWVVITIEARDPPP